VETDRAGLLSSPSQVVPKQHRGLSFTQHQHQHKARMRLILKELTSSAPSPVRFFQLEGFHTGGGTFLDVCSEGDKRQGRNGPG